MRTDPHPGAGRAGRAGEDEGEVGERPAFVDLLDPIDRRALARVRDLMLRALDAMVAIGGLPDGVKPSHLTYEVYRALADQEGRTDREASELETTAGMAFVAKFCGEALDAHRDATARKN